MTVAPKLSLRTLEEILIAITKAEDHRGLKIQLFACDVLQEWVIAQMPEVVRSQRPSASKKEHPCGIVPLEFKVLVKPSDVEVDPVLKRARERGIQLPQDVVDREFAAQIVAEFIAKGGNAFEDWKDATLPKAGDRILIAKYAGVTVKGADGVEYRMLNDKDISGLITREGVSRV